MVRCLLKEMKGLVNLFCITEIRNFTIMEISKLITHSLLRLVWILITPHNALRSSVFMPLSTALHGSHFSLSLSLCPLFFFFFFSVSVFPSSCSCRLPSRCSLCPPISPSQAWPAWFKEPGAAGGEAWLPITDKHVTMNTGCRTERGGMC